MRHGLTEHEMNRLPDLEAWAVFAKAAETGSFAKAAAALSLSPVTVSKAISRLEARTGTMLFHRTSRRISLTASGLAALERAARILEDGVAVEAEVAEQSNALRGPIRIAAPMSFGVTHLAPLLPAFMSAHPEVTLDVQYSDDQTDLVANGFDLALRIASLEDSSLLARRLCTIRIHLVGAPAYFEQHGVPKHPRDLGRHRALQYAYSRTGESWRFRHARHGEFAQTVPTVLRANNAEALIPALRSGLGLALQPEFLVWQDVQSGALNTAMAPWMVEPISLNLLTPPGRRRPARVDALMEFLATAFGSKPWAKDVLASG